VDRRRAVVRLLVLTTAIACAFAAVALSGLDPRELITRSGAIGPVLFVALGGALSLALFPGQVTATLSGVLFGALAGTALALAAALLGALLALLVARALGADAVLSLLGPKARKARDWVAENGFGAVLASRLAPGVPAGVVNYVAGLSGIKTKAFAAAVGLGALPKTIAYVALGGALADPLSTRGAIAIGLYVLTAGAGALVARKLLRTATWRKHPA
jgi:uncharacterized membrane protein YdjX (TVP38/TMEM64 family)